MSYLNDLVVFPTFFNLSESYNKELMIWATVSTRSCFCWLYRASPSSVAKTTINLILVLTIWWCPCVESSLVLFEEGVCYDQCIFLGKLYYSLPCFILYSKAKFACYSRCFLTSYFCTPVPYNEKDTFFGNCKANQNGQKSVTLLHKPSASPTQVGCCNLHTCHRKASALL